MSYNIEDLKNELREWMRKESPLTTYYKSLKCEGADQSGASDADKAKVEQPAFSQEELDELPTDVKARLTKLLDDNKTTKATAAELETKRQQTETFARSQQSRADRLEGVVKSHNLPIDGQSVVQQTPEQAAINSRYERLKAGGMEDKAAMAYAKMLADEAKQQREEILSTLGPLVGSVGSMQADRVLSDAKNGYQQVFANVELSQQIHQNVENLKKAGTPVTKETVDHLVSMAWGSHILKNPEAMKQQQTQIPQFGSTFSGGGHYTPPISQQNQAPTATQPETVSIISALSAELNRGLPKRK